MCAVYSQFALGSFVSVVLSAGYLVSVVPGVVRRHNFPNRSMHCVKRSGLLLFTPLVAHSKIFFLNFFPKLPELGGEKESDSSLYPASLQHKDSTIRPLVKIFMAM